MKARKLEKAAFGPAAVCLLLIWILIAPSASANVISDQTLTIESDQYKYLELEAKKGGTLEIEVRVMEEGAVDIFMMNESNFDLYVNGANYDYYEKGSAMNVHTKQYSFEAPESQDYYFVVDNTEEGIAYTLATVKVRVIITDRGTPFPGTFEALLAITAGAVLVGLKRRIKRD